MNKCGACGRPYKKFRSNEQNRYLHGYIIKELSDHLGYTPEETKEVLKYMFLQSFKLINSQEVPYVRSTSDLSTVEMEEFLTKTREWASINLGLYLKLPNEILEE